MAESLAILVWWTLWPSSAHLADAAATGNMGVMMVGDDGFTGATFRHYPEQFPGHAFVRAGAAMMTPAPLQTGCPGGHEGYHPIYEW